MAEVQQGGGGGKHKGGKPKAKKASTRIDMTPMVDLAFLLLTFFMLTTSFSKPKSMEIVMPDKPKVDDPAPPKINEKNVLNLILAGNNKLYYYTGIENPQVEMATYSATSEHSIRKILLREKKANIARNGENKLMVLIKAAEGSRYKNVVDIFDEMNVTDMSRYALVDITDAEKDLITNVGGNDKK